MKAARGQQMNSIFTTWNQTVLGGAKRDLSNTAILEGVTRLSQLRSRVSTCSFCSRRISRVVRLAVHRFRESLSLRIKGTLNAKVHVRFETETEKHLALANLLADLPSGVVIFLHPVSTWKIEPVPGIEQCHQRAVCHFVRPIGFAAGSFAAALSQAREWFDDISSHISSSGCKAIAAAVGGSAAAGPGR
jgi:hypothetical protein